MVIDYFGKVIFIIFSKKPINKATNWEPVWRNPTQESMISRKAYHGDNEKQSLAVPNHTVRLGMEASVISHFIYN